MFPQLQTVIETAADELGLSPDALVTQGVRQLRNVQIEIYQISNAYRVAGIAGTNQHRKGKLITALSHCY